MGCTLLENNHFFLIVFFFYYSRFLAILRNSLLLRFFYKGGNFSAHTTKRFYVVFCTRSHLVFRCLFGPGACSRPCWRAAFPPHPTASHPAPLFWGVNLTKRAGRRFHSMLLFWKMPCAFACSGRLFSSHHHAPPVPSCTESIRTLASQAATHIPKIGPKRNVIGF